MNMTTPAKHWLGCIKELVNNTTFSKPVRIMNVCGGHERSITLAGLRSLLPKQIELIPGPGCPVCVCPEEDVYAATQIALNEDVIVVTFGDMLRVPLNVPKREVRSLEQAKARGADIRAIASPMEAVKIAVAQPHKTIVFFAAGFETTMAPVAAMIAEGIPDNMRLLLSGRRTWPAVAMLLASSQPGFDCLLAPGHVATIMGAEEWQFVVDRYRLPTAVAGFTSDSLLAAYYSVIRQHIEKKYFLDNCYRALVHEQGNQYAQLHLANVMQVTDANWRGIGNIPNSGFALKTAYTDYDARQRYPQYQALARKRMGAMPPGCDCAKVVLGKIYPTQCRLYAKACTPRNPIGPCMVSDEGACRIWWASGMRERENKTA